MRLVPSESRGRWRARGPGASGAVTGGRHIARALRLGVGGAEQWFVGRVEIGGGQAISVEPPDLGRHGDGNVDVVVAAGGVEAPGIGAEFGLPVQWLIADREQGSGRDPVTEPVRGHGRGFHVHGERARGPETISTSDKFSSQFPFAVV